MNIKIKLEPGGIMPTKATPGAAAYDVYAPANYEVTVGRSVMPLNFRLEIPAGYEAMIEPRSGFSSKGMEGRIGFGRYRFDADVLPGKIDSDYRGVIGVIIRNADEEFTLQAGTRIAQMTIRKVEDVTFTECAELSETDRGSGGFGHTGTN